MSKVNFSVGDTVSMSAGGRLMTVVATEGQKSFIDETKNVPSGMVECNWFVLADLKQGTFSARDLFIAKAKS